MYTQKRHTSAVKTLPGLLAALLIFSTAALFGQDDFGSGDDWGSFDDNQSGGQAQAGGSDDTTTRARNLDLIDTPTANTLPRGNYSFAFTGYNEGGILAKGLIGIHPSFYMGVSFDVERAIGEQEPTMNVPGAVAKFKITDGTESFAFKTAIGYDAFYAGPSGKTSADYNPFAQALYGPYIVLSRPVYMMEQQQFFNIGLRMPMQPFYRPDDTSLFVGLEIPFGNVFLLTEVERIFFDKKKLDLILFNVGLRYVLFDKMALELNFMMGPEVSTNRMLVFEYTDNF